MFLGCKSLKSNVINYPMYVFFFSSFLSYCHLAVSIRDIEFFIWATFMYTSFAWPPSGNFLDGVKLCFIIINLRLSNPTWPWTEPRSCLAAIFTTVELRTKDILFPVRVVLLWLMDPWSWSVWGCLILCSFLVAFFPSYNVMFLHQKQSI